jgi:hypothetical protein
MSIRKELKSCPFCSGKAEVGEGRYTSDYSPSCSYTWYEVVCTKCHAKTGPVRIKCFMDMSEHTVEDFHSDPSLRPKVEKLLNTHLADKRAEAIALWNTRADE